MLRSPAGCPSLRLGSLPMCLGTGGYALTYQEHESAGALDDGRGAAAILSASGTQRPKSSDSRRGAVAHVRHHLFSPLPSSCIPCRLDHAPDTSELRTATNKCLHRKRKNTPIFFLRGWGPLPPTALGVYGGCPPCPLAGGRCWLKNPGYHTTTEKEVGGSRPPLLLVLCYQIVDVPTFIRLAFQPFY